MMEGMEGMMMGANEENEPFLGGFFGGNEDNNNANADPNRQKRARDENFGGALKKNMCPTLRCCSFTVLITIIDVIMFLIAIWMYPMINTEFLAPNPHSLD
jgi:hypothetical protein